MTLRIKDAAAYVGLHPKTLQERAKAGLIPEACKPGKRWVFTQSGLEAYLASLAPHKPCHSTSAGTPGTSTSRSPAPLDFEALLARTIGPRRRSGTTASESSSGARPSSENVLPFPPHGKQRRRSGSPKASAVQKTGTGSDG